MRWIGMEPSVITGRNNVITRGYWTRRQEQVKLVDYRWPRTDLTNGGGSGGTPGSPCSASTMVTEQV